MYTGICAFGLFIITIQQYFFMEEQIFYTE